MRDPFGLALALGLAAAGACPAAAIGQTFTFAASGAPAGELTTSLSLAGGRDRAMGSGLRFGPRTTTGEIVTTEAGQARRGAYVCVDWDQHNGEDLNLLGVCEVTEPAGAKYSYQYRCNLRDNGGQDGFCWSNLYGEAGRYAGRLGMMTWRATGLKHEGQGQWDAAQ